MHPPEPALVEDCHSDDTMGNKQGLMQERQHVLMGRIKALAPREALESAVQGFISNFDFDRAIRQIIPPSLTDDGAPAEGPFQGRPNCADC